MSKKKKDYNDIVEVYNVDDHKIEEVKIPTEEELEKTEILENPVNVASVATKESIEKPSVKKPPKKKKPVVQTRPDRLVQYNSRTPFNLTNRSR